MVERRQLIDLRAAFKGPSSFKKAFVAHTEVGWRDIMAQNQQERVMIQDFGQIQNKVSSSDCIVDMAEDPPSVSWNPAFRCGPIV